MPGHVKRGGTGEPDPDPTPFLFVSYEQKQKDLARVSKQQYERNKLTILSKSDHKMSENRLRD